MEFFSSPDLWIAFATLLLLEIVLGVDNVIFISILANKLPEEQRRRARTTGLLLALVLRIILLFFAAWIIGLTEPLFTIGGIEALAISGRDLILIGGGAFLIYKAVKEIHERLEGNDHHAGGGKTMTFGAVILQILLLDVVFSLDSVITAVGMVDELYIMIAAVVIAIGLMLFTAEAISNFVNRHPTVKMLALAFLVLIGSTLLAEGFDVHIEKAVIYGPIAFAVIVELLNLAYKRRQQKKDPEHSEPVHLHNSYRLHEGDSERTTAESLLHRDPTPDSGSRSVERP